MHMISSGTEIINNQYKGNQHGNHTVYELNEWQLTVLTLTKPRALWQWYTIQNLDLNNLYRMQFSLTIPENIIMKKIKHCIEHAVCWLILIHWQSSRQKAYKHRMRNFKIFPNKNFKNPQESKKGKFFVISLQLKLL